MPKTNPTLLDATHRVLWELPAGASATTIWHRLQELGYDVPNPSSVTGRLDQLTRMGVLGPGGMVLIPPLYPAYLFADLPEPGREQLQQVLVEHNTRVGSLAELVRPMSAKGLKQLGLFLASRPRLAIVDGAPGTVIEARTTLLQLEWLRERCTQFGATTVQTFVVLREERPAA